MNIINNLCDLSQTLTALFGVADLQDSECESPASASKPKTRASCFSARQTAVLEQRYACLMFNKSMWTLCNIINNTLPINNNIRHVNLMKSKVRNNKLEIML
jgi:hypothetical protein